MKSLFSIAIIGLGIFGGTTALAEASCDLDRGRSLFNKCAICHTNAADAGHSVGPNLFAIVGSMIGGASDYLYTEELKAYGKTWTLEVLDRFLKSPMTEIPGTTMAFAGFKKEADRKNLLCYLNLATK